jgi:signal transduction histidine kinase
MTAWRDHIQLAHGRILAACICVVNPTLLWTDTYREVGVSTIQWIRLLYVEPLGLLALAACLLGSRHGWVLAAFAMQTGAAALTIAGEGPADLYVAGLYLALTLPVLAVPTQVRHHLGLYSVALAVFVVGNYWTHPNARTELLLQVTNLVWFVVGGLLAVVLFERQKRAEVEAVVLLESAVERANAADAHKTLFLANVSHELRTPLNAILGYSEMLAEEEDDASNRQDLERINRAGSYLLTLVDDLLDLSKVRAGELVIVPESLPLASFMDGLRPLMQPLADARDNALVVKVEGDLAAYADPRRTRQVLLNLVSNAAKFTHGGVLTVEAKRVGDRVHLSVRDTGVGMDAEQVGRLFEVFAQVHRERVEEAGGTGLGLALSRELARKMGGELVVESEVGVGSTFTMRLPTTAESP